MEQKPIIPARWRPIVGLLVFGAMVAILLSNFSPAWIGLVAIGVMDILLAVMCSRLAALLALGGVVLLLIVV